MTSRAAVQEIVPMQQVEITSDRLRQMARELLVQADALDALVERPKKRSKVKTQLIDPRTGKCYGKRV